MKKSVILIFTIFTLMLSSSVMQPSSAMPDANASEVAQQKAANISKLHAVVQEKGEVKVMVQLSGDTTPMGLAKMQEQKDMVSSVQSSFMKSVPSLESRVTHTYQFMPFMAMTIDENALEALENSPLVTGVYEDVLYAPQLDESVPFIGTSTAWSSGYDGSGWAVAILDTGTETSHSYFTGRVVAEACYSTTYAPDTATNACPGGVDSTATGSGVPCSSSGCNHGTHVAGIAVGDGASRDGVARGADLIAMQVFSNFSDAGICGASPAPCPLSYGSDQVAAMERVLVLSGSMNIAAVNMSLGGGYHTSACDAVGFNPTTKVAIDNLKAAGIATIISSGNSGHTDGVGAPGCISTAITVGSTTIADSFTSGDPAASDLVSSFSNSASMVDVLAPGEMITSAVLSDSEASFQGTSMSAPHVAGAWAVVKQKFPTESVDQIEARFEDTGVSVTDSKNGLAKPRIQLDGALADISILSTGSLFPADRTVTQGHVMLWHNEDDINHRIISGTVSGGTDGLFDSGDFGERTSYFRTFDTAGTFNYYDAATSEEGTITVNAVSCGAAPGSGTWTISSSCTLSSSQTAPASVVVSGGAVVTIPNGVTLNIDFANYYLSVASGSGVQIQSGGTIT